MSSHKSLGKDESKDLTNPGVFEFTDFLKICFLGSGMVSFHLTLVFFVSFVRVLLFGGLGVFVYCCWGIVFVLFVILCCCFNFFWCLWDVGIILVVISMCDWCYIVNMVDLWDVFLRFLPLKGIFFLSTVTCLRQCLLVSVFCIYLNSVRS